MKKRETLWMRYVDFNVLKDLLHLVYKNNGLLRAIELENLAIENNILIKKDTNEPFTRTTNYHYRKILEHLDLVFLKESKYFIAPFKYTKYFLTNSSFRKPLSEDAIECLREIIVANIDCRRFFFDIFVDNELPGLKNLRLFGHHAKVLNENIILTNRKKKFRSVKIEGNNKAIFLKRPDDIQAILWGVRLWALDLNITNEIISKYEKIRLIYPVNPIYSENNLYVILGKLIISSTPNSEWYLLHVPEFIEECVMKTRYSIDNIKSFLVNLMNKYPSYVMSIATSTSFIDIKTSSEKQDSIIRNSYILDKRRGYISHIRINKSITKESKYMDNLFIKEKYKLERNPFPPAATGLVLDRGDNYIPKTWINKVSDYYSIISRAGGVKAMPIIGEYGTGKTVFLKGYLKDFFEEKRIKGFYFENPGVQFYDLANTLLREIGRYEFAKALWERSKEFLKESMQKELFPKTFETLLVQLKTKAQREQKAKELLKIIKDDIKLTDDEEIAYRLSMMIVDTGIKPFFEYRDFIAGQKGALVADKEEPKYFKSLINTIIDIYGVDGVAFLIDEFEDVAISKRMTRSKSYEYLATLRKLIDVSENENLWITIAMTPEAAESTREMSPALWERFTHKEETSLKLEPFTLDETKKLIIAWLDKARTDNSYKKKLFPFNDNLMDIFQQRPDLRLPRMIIKICFFVLSEAEQIQNDPPISNEFVASIIKKYFPLYGGKNE